MPPKVGKPKTKKPETKKVKISEPKKLHKKKEGKQQGGLTGDEPELDSEDDYLSGSDASSDEESTVIEENMDEVENEDALDENVDVDDEDKESAETESESEEEETVESEAKDDEECMYKFAKSKKEIDDMDNIEEEDNFEDDNSDTPANTKYVSADKRQTKNIMTKYERVRLLGDRARQLSLGAKPMLVGAESMDPKEVARLELEKGIIPLKIERELPNGIKEIWQVSELKIIS